MSSKFKVGDTVTPLNADHCDYIMQQLVGKTLVVTGLEVDVRGREIVWAKLPGGYSWRLYSDGLRLVSNSELTAPLPEEEKPLERGDLVEFCGAIWVVFSKDANGEYMIAPLTGGSNCCYSVINKLPRVGSISKKVNRLQAQMEDCK